MRKSVAIIGRPNVGKSTLFNILSDGGKAVVHGTAGTTRDARKLPASLFDLEFDLWDTAGVEEGKSAKVDPRGRSDGQHTGLVGKLNTLALDVAKKADLIIFMCDGRDGLLPADKSLAASLRKMGKPAVLVVNKADVKGVDDAAHEFSRLGLGQPLLLSAAHSMGMDDLHAALSAHIEATPDEPEPDEIPEDEIEDTAPAKPAGPIRLAIVGRPNVGKSTLVNSLLREEAMLTGPVAGLTRESVGHRFSHSGKEFMLVDTPGLRKKGRVTENLEGMSVGQAITAIRQADIVVLVVDVGAYSVETGHWKVFEQQDAKIADVAVHEAKAMVVALNKWDMVGDKTGCLADVKEQLRHMLHTIREPVVVTMSAVKGQGVSEVIKAAAALHANMTARVSTSKLNRILESVLARRSPPLANGKVVKLKYMTQLKTNPPTIAVWGNRVDQLPESYKQFMRNQLVEILGWAALPVRLMFKRNANPFGSRDVKKAKAKQAAQTTKAKSRKGQRR